MVSLGRVEWRAHTAPVFRDVVRPQRASGWQAGKAVARRRGEDDHWAHVFLLQIPYRPHLRLGFWAGTYCPRLRELYGFTAPRTRAPHHDFWASAALIAADVPLHLMNTGAIPPSDVASTTPMAVHGSASAPADGAAIHATLETTIAKQTTPHIPRRIRCIAPTHGR